LRRDRVFTILAVLTLGTGIGVTTAAFTYFSTFFWQDALLEEPERLVSFTYVEEGGLPFALGPVPYPDLLDYRRHCRAAGVVAGWRIFGATAKVDDGQSLWTWGHAVSPGYFETLGVDPRLGRALDAEDHVEGSPRAVVLGDRFWRRAFDRARDVVGRRIEISGQSYTIVGVTPPGFIGTGVAADLYTPLAYGADVLPAIRFENRSESTVFAVARLATGATVESAETRFAAFAAALDREYPDSKRRVYLLPISGLSRRTLSAAGHAAIDYFRRSLLVLGFAALLLLLSCANVANLVVARNLGRARELAICSALGASRARLLATVGTEYLLLAVAAAAVGVATSRVVVEAMRPYLVANPVDLGHWADGVDFMTLDLRTTWFSIGASLVSIVLFGSWPALRASGGANLVTNLVERSGSARPRAGGRRCLVVVQVALSAVLLIGSLLLARSLTKIWATDAGFDRDRLVVASFAVNVAGMEDSRARQAYHELEDLVRAMPEVESAGLTSSIPLGGGRVTTVYAGNATDGEEMSYALVSPGFFATLGLPLLVGRPLDREGLQDARGAVVSARAAELLWPGSDPMDRVLRLRVFNRELSEYRVVGVVADARMLSLATEPLPAVYLSFDQVFNQRMSLLVRSRVPANALLGNLQKIFEGSDSRLALIQAATFRDHLERSLSDRRFDSAMTRVVAALALLLAAVGLASLLAFLVRARRRELAVRTALGARPRDLLQLVIGEAGAMIGVGCVVGVGAAMAWARLLRGLLYGIEPLDAPSLIAGAAVTLSVGLAAALGPAVAAMRVSPSEALRDE
jgi:putative ABC transport system permease protein